MLSRYVRHTVETQPPEIQLECCDSHTTVVTLEDISHGEDNIQVYDRFKYSHKPLSFQHELFP
jgi:hypothetical protein